MDRPKYGLHFSYIKWLSSKIQGFSDQNSRTTDPNFMLLGANRIVLMRLTDEKKTKTSISKKEIIFKGSKDKIFRTVQEDQNISNCMLTASLPIFILSHKNWVCILGINKKNHQFSPVFAKNLWSWTLDPIPYENTKISLGWILSPNQFWGYLGMWGS